MTRKRTIGVLGGMGPEATVLLMQRIIDATPAEDDHDHIPMIVDNNTRIPSRIAALIEGDGEDPGPVLCDMATRLANYGAEALAMPCNTAHHYADRIRAASPVPLLDMVQLSVARLAERVDRADGGNRRIGLLASPAVRLVGVFDRAMWDAGLTPCYPADDSALLAIIRAVKAGGVNPALIAECQEVAASLAETGVSALLIACSELSLMSRDIASELPVLDTVDVLAAACRDFSLQY